ncbi:MAG: gluconeogenesis factor YvcK family protein [Patescibacteria group bacterium]
MNNDKKIVCLGGGIGTGNLIRGLKRNFSDITVVVSMADEGGSSGRLRKMYDIFPPGDIVSCLSALAPDNSLISKLLTYRFPGDRYSRNEYLAGHKLGNLLMVALRDISDDFFTAVCKLQEIFHISGTILPATDEQVTISARTKEGAMVVGEENIDLGKYAGERVLDHVFIHPENPAVSEKVITSIEKADVLIAGPGDLYTTILPVLIIPRVKDAILKSNALKIFVVNVANKPFETKGYSIQDFISAISKHMGIFPFDRVIANNNDRIAIPKKYKYDYVHKDTSTFPVDIGLIEQDLVDDAFPLYHASDKLAKVIAETL